MSSLARTAIATLTVLISVIVAALQVYQPVARALPWRPAVFDLAVQKLSPFLKSVPKVPVRLVAIDDESIKRSGVIWPWPQAALTTLTDRIQIEHPRLLVLDLTDPAAERGTVASWDKSALSPKLAGSAADVRAAWSLPEHAGAVPLLVANESEVRPSFELATALAYFRADLAHLAGVSPNIPELGLSGVHSVTAGKHAFATNPDASLILLPAAAPTGLKSAPAWQVLAGEPHALEALAGSVVVIRRSSADPSSAGWQHTQALAQLLNALTPARTPWAPFAEAELSILAAAGVAAFMLRGRASAAVSLVIATVLIAAGTGAALFFLKLQLVDPIAPAVFLLPAFFLGAMGYAANKALSREPKEPPKAIRVAGTQVRGTERREVTVLVCKIREIEAVTEAHRDNPEALAQVVTKLLSTVAEITRAHRGTVEHVSGGMLVAVFNAPLEDHRHTEHAVEAALAMLSRLEPLNEGFERLFKAGFTHLNLSIGIETAEALIGDLGFKDKGELSVLGPALDTARTLVERAQTYGPAILVGPGAWTRINRSFALLELDVAPIGNAAPKPFYALMGNPVVRANPRFKALQEGFDAFHFAYRKGHFDQARALLEQCSRLPGANPRLVSLYQKRLDFLKSRSPDASWDGILRMPVE